MIAGQGNALQSAAALATAGYAASTGLRVLIASVGPTHLLGALLSQTLNGRPQEVAPNLSALEITARDEIGQRWDQVRPNLRTGMIRRLGDVGSDELPAFPGMDAVAALLIAERAARTGRFDLLVFDGPSTESLLRTVTLPDTLRWFVRLFFGLDRGPGRSRASQEAAIIPVALISPTVVAPLQDFRVVLEGQRTRLDSSSGTQVRLVLPAEELRFPAVRQELCGLGLYGIHVDTVLARGEAEQLDEADRQRFVSTPGAPRPALIFHELPTAPTDMQGWIARGAQIYATRPEGLGLPDVATPPDTGTAPELREVELHMPFFDGRDLDIAVASEEVVVRVGPFRRHVLLPALAAGGRLRARVEGENLKLWVEEQ
jgi:anion-transporting  ArsA/GET3 family ATPase